MEKLTKEAREQFICGKLTGFGEGLSLFMPGHSKWSVVLHFLKRAKHHEFYPGNVLDKAMEVFGKVDAEDEYRLVFYQEGPFVFCCRGKRPEELGRWDYPGAPEEKLLRKMDLELLGVLGRDIHDIANNPGGMWRVYANGLLHLVGRPKGSCWWANPDYAEAISTLVLHASPLIKALFKRERTKQRAVLPLYLKPGREEYISFHLEQHYVYAVIKRSFHADIKFLPEDTPIFIAKLP